MTRGTGINYISDSQLAKDLESLMGEKDYQALNKTSLMNERKPLDLQNSYQVAKALVKEGHLCDPSSWQLLEVM